MTTVAIYGLKLKTSRKYLKFTKAKYNNIRDDSFEDTLYIDFAEGATAEDFFGRKVDVYSPNELLQETKYIKIRQFTAKINGLIIKNLSPFEYQYHQILLDGIKEFVIDYSNAACNILIPREFQYELDAFLKCLQKCPFIEILDYSELHELHNVFGVELNDRDIEITTTNDHIFNPRDYYERYRVRDIDAVASFKQQFKTLLSQYGVDLVRYPIDEQVSSTERVVYRVTEYGVQETWRSGYQPLNDVVRHKTTIDFEATFLNQTILDDFRTRYQNYDLVTNFTEYYVRDKYGKLWKCSVKCNPISTDWNADYNQDQQGNVGVTCTFQCELRYYVIYDKYYWYIKQIVLTREYENQVGGGRVTEESIDNYVPEEDIPTLEPTTPIEDQIEEWIKLREQV